MRQTNTNNRTQFKTVTNITANAQGGLACNKKFKMDYG